MRTGALGEVSSPNLCSSQVAAGGLDRVWQNLSLSPKSVSITNSLKTPDAGAGVLGWPRGAGKEGWSLLPEAQGWPRSHSTRVEQSHLAGPRLRAGDSGLSQRLFGPCKAPPFLTQMAPHSSVCSLPAPASCRFVSSGQAGTHRRPPGPGPWDFSLTPRHAQAPGHSSCSSSALGPPHRPWTGHGEASLEMAVPLRSQDPGGCHLASLVTREPRALPPWLAARGSCDLLDSLLFAACWPFQTDAAFCRVGFSWH